MAGTSHVTSNVINSGTVTVGAAGTALSKIVKGVVAVDCSSLLTLTYEVLTLTITGATVLDTVIMNPGTAGLNPGIFFVAPYVSAADTVKVTVFNATAGTLDAASLSCPYMLIRA
jgi:hypothetical protein